MKIVLQEKNSYTRLLALRLAMDLKAEVHFAEDEDPARNVYDFILKEEETGVDTVEGGKTDAGPVLQKNHFPVLLHYSKLTPASHLIQKIRSIWLVSETGLQNFPVITVTSACGGQGCSLAAETLCKLLYRTGKHVLFLSLDPYLGPPDKTIYDILSGKEGCGEDLLYTIAEHRMYEDCTGPVISNGINQLSCEEMKILFRSLAANCSADILVIDAPLASPHWKLCAMLSEELYLVRMVNADTAADTDGVITGNTAGNNAKRSVKTTGKDGTDGKFRCLQACIQRYAGDLIPVRMIENERADSFYEACCAMEDRLGSLL